MDVSRVLSMIKEEAYSIDRDNIINEQLISEMRKAGFFGHYDGASSARSRLEIVREIARESTGVASVVLINLSVQYMLYHFMDVAQLPSEAKEVIRGNVIAAVSLTEKGGGSDLTRNITVNAVADGDKFKLYGEKVFTSNGLYADIFLVLAKHGNEPKIFLTSDKANIKVEPMDLSVFRGAGISRVIYEGAEAVELVSAKPLRTVLQAINIGRLGYSAIGIGIAEGALEDALSYASQRKAFGAPLIEFQGIRWMLAETFGKLLATRSLFKRILSSIPDISPVEAAVAKMEAASIAQRAAWVNVEVHGGSGLEKHTKPERLQRDARAIDLGEGAREVLLNMVASSLVKNRDLLTE